MVPGHSDSQKYEISMGYLLAYQKINLAIYKRKTSCTLLTSI